MGDNSPNKKNTVESSMFWWILTAIITLIHEFTSHELVTKI